jgi:hypothetical protein
MPKTKLQVYQDDSGSSEVLDWMELLPPTPHEEFEDYEDEDDANTPVSKCYALLNRLRSEGCQLRRPQADILRDNIWELRWRVRNVQYRILYTFIGKDSALLLLGCTKEKEVPSKLIDQAKTMRDNAIKNPQKHIKADFTNKKR